MKMRVVTLVFALLFSSFFAVQAQPVKPEEVPYNIRETFYAKFQKVSEVKWEKKPRNIYLVSFRKADKNLMAEFSDDGRWQSTQMVISVGEVPRDIVAAVAKKMPGHRMKKGLKQETYSRGVIYTITTEKDKKAYEFTFTPKGKLLYYTEPVTGNP